LQQAGIAELGPYMTNLRSWKIRVYRALFNAAQSYWVNERWIRVTDAQGEPQFVQINAEVPGPDGMPQKMNAIGELDVDIILDEGPDTVTLMQDTYDAIAQALPAVSPMLSPTKSAAVMDVLIETSPLPADVKKRFRDAGEQEQTQPDPKAAEAQANLALKEKEAQAKLQLQQQEAAARIASDQQAAQSQIQIKQQTAAAEMQIRREAAGLEMQLERDKAHNAIQLEMFKAGQDAQARQQEAALEIATGHNITSP
jgi:beta-galactosidase/beta-glucuronidase